MGASVLLSTPDGHQHELGPGSIIGRLETAALRINDPQISETHALVSLRGASLKLLALRGRIRVGGVLVGELALQAGQVIELTPQLSLHVLCVRLPDSVLALEGPALPRFILPRVTSIVRGELVAGFVPDADAVMWIDGDNLCLREAGQPDRLLGPGDQIAAGDQTLALTEVRLAAAAAADTAESDPRRFPLVLVLRYDSVIVRRAADSIPIDGLAARLITELAQMRGPVEWRTLVTQLWPGDGDDEGARARFDALLGRLRKRLRETRLPSDLVRTDRRGRLQLLLGKHDRVLDES